jgi:thiol:disulfide interchange protein DsbD
VSTLGSTLLGFLFLFLFGIGLGFPLLLVGTFSSSMNLLPRAGGWMLEVKTVVGLMLLATSLYFMRPLLPEALFLILCALIIAGASLYYLTTATRTHHRTGRWIKNSIGIALFAATIVVAAYAYKAYYVANNTHEDIWHTDYCAAEALAREENTLLFIDVGSPFCTLCTAIDKKLLSRPEVLTALKKCVCVKVNSADTSDSACVDLQKKYSIVGVPAILLINPHTGDVCKRWAGELYDTPAHEFIAQIEQCVTTQKNQ